MHKNASEMFSGVGLGFLELRMEMNWGTENTFLSAKLREGPRRTPRAYRIFCVQPGRFSAYFFIVITLYEALELPHQCQRAQPPLRKEKHP